MIRHTLAALLIAAPGVLILEQGTEAAAPKWSACEYEDGSSQRRCVWDGRHMGNGEGQSLIIRRGGTDAATYTIVTHKRAHRLIRGGQS